MSVKSANLRFLVALGNTKIIVLQDENNLHVYSKTECKSSQQKLPIMPEHVAEAIFSK